MTRICSRNVTVWDGFGGLNVFRDQLVSLSNGGYSLPCPLEQPDRKSTVGVRVCHLVSINTDGQSGRFKPKLGLPEVALVVKDSDEPLNSVLGVVESSEFLPSGLSAEDLVKVCCGGPGPACFKPLLLRLFSYMKLNKTCFGLITTWDTTWYIVADAEFKTVGISQPVSRTNRPLLHLWLVLKMSMNKEVQSLTGSLRNCSSFLRSVRTPGSVGTEFQQELESASHDWEVPMHIDVTRKLQVWSCETLFGIMTEKLSRLGQHNEHDVFGGSFQGERVVIKVTDLSHDHKSMVASFAREVQAYMILQPLQGSVVPRLLAHGIANGSMLGFCVLSHAGQLHSGMEEGWDVVNALDKIHRLGVVQTKMRSTDVLRDEGKPVTIVGFSSCCFFKPGSPSKKHLRFMQKTKDMFAPDDEDEED